MASTIIGIMYSTNSITNVNIDFIYLVGVQRLDKPNMAHHSQCHIHLDFVTHRDKLRKNGSFSNYIENITCPSIANLNLTLSILYLRLLLAGGIYPPVASAAAAVVKIVTPFAII